MDAIILATGYEHHLQNILNLGSDRLNDLNKCVDQQSNFGKDGLYFCGFYVAPTGVLREIGIEARKISKDMANKKTV